MNVKSITSKLYFLENLIVEMNPVNLEELKTLSLEKISEIIYDLIIYERANFIRLHTPLDFDAALVVAKLEKQYVDILGMEIDVVSLMNVTPSIGSIYNSLKYRLTLENPFHGIPEIGELLKLEFEKPKTVYDKPASKYFTKPKNNFKKR